MIVRTRGDANKSASASPVVARARPGQALPSKSPLVSPRTGEGQQPLSSPRTGGEGARSPPVSPRPAGAAYLMLLDSRSDFIGPFVIEYEVLDKRTGKLAWMTTEDMDARHGPGAADWLIAQFEQNPPPQRQRPEVTVPEEPRSPAAAPAPVPLPAPAPAAASAPALRKKGTLLDKLDDAINRKLGGPTSPRRQVWKHLCLSLLENGLFLICCRYRRLICRTVLRQWKKARVREEKVRGEKSWWICRARPPPVRGPPQAPSKPDKQTRKNPTRRRLCWRRRRRRWERAPGRTRLLRRRPPELQRPWFRRNCPALPRARGKSPMLPEPLRRAPEVRSGRLQFRRNRGSR